MMMTMMMMMMRRTHTGMTGYLDQVGMAAGDRT
jgi:hypothetical protein